jgi:hypothetical protein
MATDLRKIWYFCWGNILQNVKQQHGGCNNSTFSFRFEDENEWTIGTRRLIFGINIHTNIQTYSVWYTVYTLIIKYDDGANLKGYVRHINVNEICTQVISSSNDKINNNNNNNILKTASNKLWLDQITSYDHLTHESGTLANEQNCILLFVLRNWH